MHSYPNSTRTTVICTCGVSPWPGKREPLEHFRNFVTDDLRIGTALAATAKLGRTRDDLVDPFKMRGQLVAARMILPVALFLVGRIAVLGRLRQRAALLSAATSSLETAGSRSSSCNCRSDSFTLCLPYFLMRSRRSSSSSFWIFIADRAMT